MIMKATLFKRTILAAMLFCALASAASAQEKMETRDTRIGKLEFQKGYPSEATVKTLYNELDFQRACQAYIWGLPAVASMHLAGTYQSSFGATYGDLLSLTTYDDLSYGITANATTPYYLLAYDLEKLGPVVFEGPAGATAGFIDDLWQRPVADLGIPGV